MSIIRCGQVHKAPWELAVSFSSSRLCSAGTTLCNRSPAPAFHVFPLHCQLPARTISWNYLINEIIRIDRLCKSYWPMAHADGQEKRPFVPPLTPSCPPGGRSGAGVGVGMLRGAGNSKIIQDFKDSKKLFSMMYHNCSRSQRFQKMIFRARLQNINFENLLRFQDISKNIFKIIE